MYNYCVSRNYLKNEKYIDCIMKTKTRENIASFNLIECVHQMNQIFCFSAWLNMTMKLL